MTGKIVSLLFLIFYMQCSTRTVSENSKEADQMNDSADVITENVTTDPVTEGEIADPYLNDDTLQTAIELAVEQIIAETPSAHMYSLQASYNGYESSSDATYYFDSVMNLLSVEATWSMEGTSGSYQYFFNDDELYAGREENYYNDYEESVILHQGFDPAFGFSRTTGTENDSSVTWLQEADFLSRKNDFISTYNRLIQRIGEADSIDSDEENIRFKIETEADYGQKIIESESFELSRNLYNYLF